MINPDDPRTWKLDLPSAEHRAHIRRFVKSDLTDAEDVAIRGFVFWKRMNWAAMERRDQRAREK